MYDFSKSLQHKSYHWKNFIRQKAAPGGGETHRNRLARVICLTGIANQRDQKKDIFCLIQRKPDTFGPELRD
jgi:hypothetical protein